MYASQLGIPATEFKASNGWLNRFHQRHNINFASVCGGSGSVPQQNVDDWMTKLPEIVTAYEPKDIYNMDETGRWQEVQREIDCGIMCEHGSCF